MKKDINILGIKYKIIEDLPEQNSKLINANGYCEVFSKEIILDKKDYSKDYNTVKNFSALKRKVLRHEIIHAFFYESGLKQYCDDETITDWIAVQFPKLAKIFKDLNIGE